ncbi:MAG: calcium-binding protein [Okeania sp. SIO2C9]|uniref:calcium-binding protein n=1 Tax=Okeania sp. SIO2C9 TaxID=2607791 RepID=UPI0013C147A2|nr:hypothetical protein [Okeania sp. SIO2C9]NEQ77568.1 calcium-binding protein [Okeania sp. SIO2C9]
MTTIIGTENSELLTGSSDADEIFGLAGDDTINGLESGDLISGNQGNDILDGNAGNDTLRGGKGNDNLSGDLGSDNIYGDVGTDTLTGGEGFDNFVLQRQNQPPTGDQDINQADLITDFNLEQDAIGLLGGITFEELNIFQGSNELADSTIIQDTVTGEFLAILSGVNSSELTEDQFRTFVQQLGPYSSSTQDPGKIDSAIPGFISSEGEGLIRPDSIVNPTFTAWATGFQNYSPAPGVDERFQTPELTLGPTARTDNFIDIASLGDLTQEQIDAGVPPGEITLTFDSGISNGAGADFAVFENGFNNLGGIFAELAFVEVSSDGVNFARFPSDSLTEQPLGSFDVIDPTQVYNLAGKHVNNASEFEGEFFGSSWGTPFDLDDLVNDPLVTSGAVDINAIRFVRIVDIPGNGSFLDATGDPIFDPWTTAPPTATSGGFDLEAIGVINVI